MTLDYCPRCLARRHVAQPLVAAGALVSQASIFDRATLPAGRPTQRAATATIGRAD